MHQIELKCVAYGYPSVSIFWMKAGEHLNNEQFIFDNDGKTKKVKARERSLASNLQVYRDTFTLYCAPKSNN